jgi:hypothetical protein
MTTRTWVGGGVNQLTNVDGKAVVNADVTGTGFFTAFEAHSSGKLELVHSVPSGWVLYSPT